MRFRKSLGTIHALKSFWFGNPESIKIIVTMPASIEWKMERKLRYCFLSPAPYSFASNILESI